MIPDVWKKNIAVLAARYPALAERLEKTALPALPGVVTGATRSDACSGGAVGPDIRVDSAASGSPTLIINGIHIHSNRDPVKEGSRQTEAAEKAGNAEKAGDTGHKVFVILGFGLGYGAEAAAKASNLPVVVAERRPELFRLALESRDLGEFLSSGKHILVVGGEPGGITGALGILEQAGIKEAPLLVKNRALCSISAEDREWYDDAERRIH
ncbi:MAG: hypothetical protein LBP69_02000, partial [Treponema sp.]|nr:hypothetical protein [Treponema sp.]